MRFGSQVVYNQVVRSFHKVPDRISEIRRGNWTHGAASLNRACHDFNIVDAQEVKHSCYRDCDYKIGREKLGLTAAGLGAASGSALRQIVNSPLKEFLNPRP